MNRRRASEGASEPASYLAREKENERASWTKSMKEIRIVGDSRERKKRERESGKRKIEIESKSVIKKAKVVLAEKHSSEWNCPESTSQTAN